MNIDTMPAGQEMDALIGRLMGLVYNEKRDYWVKTEKSPEWVVILPHYSTDIGDAWEVAGHLMTTITPLPIQVCVAARNGFRQFGVMPMSHPGEYSWGDTLPLAICRAVLKATGYPG